MIGPLFRKAIGDAKWLFAALLVLMFVFPWAFLWASGQINAPAFSEFLANALPQRWQRIWGVPFSQVATPAGRAALVFVHPLIVFSAVVWTVTRGSDCVSGEIGRGTMEMLLAQPVRRTSIYITHTFVTSVGSMFLASAVWCGIAIGLRSSPLYEHVRASLFIPPAVNLFAVMVCLGGGSAMVSSCDSQRWRTIGIVATWYVLSTVLTVLSQIVDRCQWLGYGSIMSAYKPQTMVVEPERAWSLFTQHDGAIVGLGVGGQLLALFAVGLTCYVIGAIVFSRREIPAPL
jgi:ABC-2 type transport system permease protein